MIKIVLLTVFLALAGCTGCANTPKTVPQAQVVSYSQIASTMQEANRLYQIGVLNDKQHREVHLRLTQAYELVIGAEEYKDLPQQYKQAKERITEIYDEAKEMLE